MRLLRLDIGHLHWPMASTLLPFAIRTRAGYYDLRHVYRYHHPAGAGDLRPAAIVVALAGGLNLSVQMGTVFKCHGQWLGLSLIWWRGIGRRARMLFPIKVSQKRGGQAWTIIAFMGDRP